MARNISALVMTALLALSCGSSEPAKETVDDEKNALLNRAMITLDAAPAPVREEVLKTCDKWRHIDHPCMDEEVRVAQLECWLETGIPELQIVLTQRIGPRARNIKVLMKQNLCMEQRRWRKLEPGPDL